MDGTQPSRSNSEATRKRRSSILKSQRPPRTPFSELEFNVATPTDTAKSRRVSFSRRTGVAEFATNEATTTWKNFYEEHNKSLESSGNDSAVNASRHPVGPGPKRNFACQFQEIEAEIDIVENLGNPRNRNIVNTSLSNGNFTQQFASLECLDDDQKVAAPQKNFELSALTDHNSKIFCDGLSNPIASEASDLFDVNFSTLQPLSSNDDKDDLDEIVKDLEQGKQNLCPGPFRGQREVSQYIEVDLSLTRVPVRNDESDMSITDTIHEPKVREVSKNSSAHNSSNKSTLNNDWTMDKENIAINPYETPPETDNFAINESSNNILVFDGKRLTIQPEKDGLQGPSVTEKKKSIIPETKRPMPRKTIVLNMDDDLPNFVDVASNSSVIPNKSSHVEESFVSRSEMSLNQSLIMQTNASSSNNFYANITGNLSMTQALPNSKIYAGVTAEKTVLYDKNVDISMTQALTSNVVLTNKREKERTIQYESGKPNLSMTEVIQDNVIIDNNTKTSSKRQTIVFDNDAGEISMTQVLPTNLVECIDTKLDNNDKRKTIVFDDDMGNLSVTQVLPSNLLLSDKEKENKSRRTTIVFENDAGDISMTQMLPTNLDLFNIKENETTNKRRTILFDNDMGNLSVTQAIPKNILITNDEQRKTDAVSDISMTQALPTKLIVTDNVTNAEKRKTIVFDDSKNDISVTQALPINILQDIKHGIKKRNTIVFDNDMGNVSITQALPNNFFIGNNQHIHKNDEDILTQNTKEKRKTIVFENEESEISITKAIPTNLLIQENINENNLIDKVPVQTNDETDKPGVNRRTLIFNNSTNDILITQALPSNFLSQPTMMSEKNRNTIVFDEVNRSITQVMTSNISEVKQPSNKNMSIIKKDLNISNLNNDFDVKDHAQISTTIVLDKNELGNTIETKHGGNGNENKKDQSFGNLPASEKYLNITNDGFSLRKSEVKFNHEFDNKSIIVYQATTNLIQNKSEIKPVEQGDVSTIERNANASNTSNDINKSIDKAEVENESKYKNEDGDNDMDTSTQKVVEITASKSLTKKSLLCDLLDMSNASMFSGYEDKNNSANMSLDDSMGQTELASPHVGINKDNIIKSNSKQETNISRINPNTSQINPNTSQINPNTSQINPNTSQINPNTDQQNEYPRKNASDDSIMIILPDNDIGVENNIALQTKLDDMEFVMTDDQNAIKSSQNEETAMDRSVEVNAEENESKTENSSKIKVKDANDTEELLTMLSDLTDQPQTEDSNIDEEYNNTVHRKYHSDYKSDDCEPRRISIAPHRQSIALSREDLINNISMAQALLQKSRAEFDESEAIEVTATEPSPEKSKKTVRLSHEVVKKLHFDEDESFSNPNIKHDNISPLKKTAFGETAYLKDTKANVIPTFLKDVSDGLKEIMLDLTKPMADVIPFDCKNNIIGNPSTRSTQIQANLVTSSQIDIETELNSTPESSQELSLLSQGVASLANKAVERALKSSFKTVTNIESERSSEMEIDSDIDHTSRPIPRSPAADTVPGKVVMFDHSNPLNNVLLPQLDFSKVHTYNPESITEITKINKSMNSLSSMKTNETEVERISVHYNINNKSKDAISLMTINSPTHQIKDEQDKLESDFSSEKESTVSSDNTDVISVHSNTSKPISIDESIESRVYEVRDTEVNTVIAMKVNNELLETSSSLTLVEDPSGGLRQSELQHKTENFELELSDSEMENKMDISEDRTKKTPLKIVFKIEEEEITMDKIEVDELVKKENTIASPCKTKTAKKRIYSPMKRVSPRKSSNTTTYELSPKQITKMQKISNSPILKTILNARHKSPEKSVRIAGEENSNSDNNVIDVDLECQPLKVSPNANDSTKRSPNKSIRKSNSPRNKMPEMSEENSNSGTNIIDVDSEILHLKRHPNSNDSIKRSPKKSISKSNSPKKMPEMSEENSNSGTNIIDVDLEILNLKRHPNSNDSIKRSPKKSISKSNSPKKMPEMSEENSNSGTNIIDVDSEILHLKEHPNSNDSSKRSPKKSIRKSNSPKNKMSAMSEENSNSDTNIIDVDSEILHMKERTNANEAIKRSPKKSIRKSTSPKNKKPGTTITVQQVITEYKIDNQIVEVLDDSKQSDDTSNNSLNENVERCMSPDTVVSFTTETSEGNEIKTETNDDRERMSDSMDESDWKPDIGNDSSSKNLLKDCESLRSNVITKIEMLSFIGSPECEWETCSDKFLSFRLLHGRVRLAVKLSKGQNSSTFIRSDTNVEEVTLDSTSLNKKNSIACLCVRFALSSMRQSVARGVTSAADVPQLLRRCAASSRVAAHWGRAMYDAKQHLAFSLDNEGRLALKVANFPLRSVWEVRMRVQMLADDATRCAFPQACDVTVNAVVSDVAVEESEIASVVKKGRRDWGNAPSTVWRIFKYLKHKTQDESLTMGL